MRILAIESAALAAGAAVLADGVLISEQYTNNGLTHSRTLMGLVDGALTTAELRVDDMDVIAVSAGPGSFTGVRIGVGIAKGLALAAEKPVAPVSSLLGLAYGVSVFEGRIAPIMDARRGEVYGAVYDCKNGVLTEVTPMCAMPLTAFLEPLSGVDVLFTGDGVQPHRNAIMATMGAYAHFAPPQLLYHHAAGIALAATHIMPVSPHAAEPIYLRKSQAEREYEALHKNE